MDDVEVGSDDGSRRDNDCHFTYLLRQIQPSNGFCAAFGEINRDSGETVIFTKPIHFVGLAVQTFRWVDGEGNAQKRKSMAIVGIEFHHGMPEIVNTHPQFGGMVAPGEDPEECVGFLDEPLYKRLPKRIRDRLEKKPLPPFNR